MIPVVCVMEWVLHNKHYSREVKASVLVVVVGVGICTVTDVKVNAKGFICASTAVFSTSLQQIVSAIHHHSLNTTLSSVLAWKFSSLLMTMLKFCFLETVNRFTAEEILSRLFRVAEQDCSNPSPFSPHIWPIC